LLNPAKVSKFAEKTVSREVRMTGTGTILTGGDGLATFTAPIGVSLGTAGGFGGGTVMTGVGGGGAA
jgi:hypothetical protein